MEKGFTVVELMIVLGIFAVLFAVGLPIGLDAYRNYLLNSETINLVSFLRRAQSLSFSNRNSSAHGLYLTPDKFIVFEGLNYLSRNASQDQEFYRSTSVQISGPQEIVFSSLSGNPNISGELILGNLLNVQKIEINEQGVISW